MAKKTNTIITEEAWKHAASNPKLQHWLPKDPAARTMFFHDFMHIPIPKETQS